MRLELGNCLDVLKDIPDNSIDSIITDPPYGISFMNRKWDYDVPTTEIWMECLRVLKPGGHLLSFGGSRTYHRMAVRIEDAGFDIRDQIMWIYGSGFPKSHNIGKAVDKIEGNEREVVGEKKNKINLKATKEGDKSFYENAWQNKDYIDLPITKGQSDWEGWGTALKPAHEPIVLARKPLSEKSVALNVLKWGTGGLNIDVSRIVIGEGDRTRAGHRTCNIFETEKISGGNGSPDYETHEAGRFPANIIFDDDTDEPWKRYFYCAKASKKDRDDNNNHPTVKPTELMLYLIKLITPIGGTILDPFMGSGSTGKAAIRGGFDFIGIEREEEYIKIAEARINNELK